MPSNSDTLVFTLCSNNYLSYAQVLAQSMKRFEPGKTFVIGLVDRRRDDIPYDQLGCPVIEIASVVKDIFRYAAKFSIVELNTFAKPAFFQYFFNHFPVERIIFLDPDTCLFSQLDEVDSLLDKSDIVLTPHVVTPIPLDGKTPEEALFLNYGIFNFGFLAIKKTGEALHFLEWWRVRTYERGFDRPASGLFTDQIWGNLVPVYFKNVHVLQHRGHNMALWNLHERKLTAVASGFLVNDTEKLVFYHFSGILGDPARIARDYSRFNGAGRHDLLTLYADYRLALQSSPFSRFAAAICFYSSYTEQNKPEAAAESGRRRLLYRIIKWIFRISKLNRSLPVPATIATKS